ncbi:unnamed protein product, partial [Phaeothamnion confervicola]
KKQFEFPVRGIAGGHLHESYQGVYLNVSYRITCEVERGFMRKPVRAEAEFFVEVPTRETPPDLELPFMVTPESLENVRRRSRSKLPKFRISGRLHHASWPVDAPLTGEVAIEWAETPVKSVEVQLIRVETVSAAADGGGGDG